MMIAAILVSLAIASDPGVGLDRTEIALERCLSSSSAAPSEVPDSEDVESAEAVPPAEVSEEGRSACYDRAVRAYDGRILKTYRRLLGKASPDEADWLARTNQAWLEYRAAATDGDVVGLARDHARWLDGLRRH